MFFWVAEVAIGSTVPCRLHQIVCQSSSEAAKAFQCLPEAFISLNLGKHLATTVSADSACNMAGSKNEMDTRIVVFAIADFMQPPSKPTLLHRRRLAGFLICPQ
jgi:hypothetical protein